MPTLVFKAMWGLALKYLVDVTFRPHSASSHNPLRFSHRHRLDLLVPRRRTAMTHSFTSNWSLFLECTLSFCTLYFSFSQSLFFLCLSQSLFLLMRPSLLNGSSPLEALYKCLNTICVRQCQSFLSIKALESTVSHALSEERDKRGHGEI